MSPFDSVEIFPSAVNSSFEHNVTFNCTSKGGPSNQYQWTHLETEEILHDRPTLLIESISFDNSGTYECLVTNEAGFGSEISVLNGRFFSYK